MTVTQQMRRDRDQRVRPQFTSHFRTNKCIHRDKIKPNEIQKRRKKMMIAIDVEEWKIKHQIKEYLWVSFFYKYSQM